MKHLLALGLTICVPTLLFSQASAQISYQGYLTDGTGTPINTPTDLVIKLFVAATGGTEIWTNTYAATPVSEGYYHVMLETGTPALATVSFDQPLWLQVRAGGELQMPRTPLAMVPYAQSLRNLRVEPATADEGPNMIGGYSGNMVMAGVMGATVAGGGNPNYFGTHQPNKVEADYGTISGGAGNTASGNGYSTVSGGRENAASNLGSAVGGGSKNTASGNSATIGGGGANIANGSLSTIGGGGTNTTEGGVSAIGGGAVNKTLGRWSTIPGGLRNMAGGDFSFAGGYRARVRDSTQTGESGSGDLDWGDEGTFVWSDRSVFSQSNADNFESTGPNQFLIRAAGGVGIGTNQPFAQVHIEESTSRGALRLNQTGSGRLAEFQNDGTTVFEISNTGSLILKGQTGGGNDDGLIFSNPIKPDSDIILVAYDGIAFHLDEDGSNTNSFFEIRNGANASVFRVEENGTVQVGGTTVHSSDVNRKHNFESVDAAEVLESVADLELKQWSYKGDEVRHLGPMAQGFYAAFGLGQDETTIASIDADGVALAAIQGLNQKLEQEVRQVRLENEELKQRLAELERVVGTLLAEAEPGKGQ